MIWGCWRTGGSQLQHRAGVDPTCAPYVTWHTAQHSSKFRIPVPRHCWRYKCALETVEDIAARTGWTLATENLYGRLCPRRMGSSRIGEVLIQISFADKSYIANPAPGCFLSFQKMRDRVLP